jgi:Membrane protein involved in the export of O-antigen and teichoic acid
LTNNICKICGGESRLYSEAVILFKYNIKYFQCSRCGFIQTEEPYWFDEAYSEAINRSDIGLVQRNISFTKVTKLLIKFLFNRKAQFIDYGAGYGIFVRLMRDAGLKFFWQDKYCENLFAKGFEYQDAQTERFELLTAFEVFEHLISPADEMQEMLKYSDSIFFSTYLLPGGNPKPQDWWYFATDHGQHISIYTKKSLEELAKKYGLYFYTNGKNLHLFSKKKKNNFLFKVITFPFAAELISPFVKLKSLHDEDYITFSKKLKRADKLGIVRTQALKNTIFSYIGVGLGYVNLILLFPAFFSAEEFGLFQLILSVSVVYAQVGALGLQNAINRYFPFFRTEDKTHKGFLTLITVIGAGGFIISTIIYLLIRPWVVTTYAQNAGAFNAYYYIIILLTLFTDLFQLLEVVARVIFKTVFATFLKEVAIRLFTTIGIVLYVFRIINFDGFINFYVLISFLSALLLLIQIIASGEFKWEFKISKLKWKDVIELLRYGGYNLLSGAAMLIGQRVDVLMIGAMVGLQVVGAYTLYYYVASVIYVPMRSLSKISVAIIANAFKTGETEKISDIYRRTSQIQLIFGALIYIGVIINKYNLFYFIKKTEYIQNFNIFILVGLAILIDVPVGLNSEIISNSYKFRLDAFFNILLLIISVIANLIFIPLFGGVGAGLAAVVSFFSFNFMKWLYIKIRFKMQPVNYKQLLIVITAVICFLIGDKYSGHKKMYIWI